MSDPFPTFEVHFHAPDSKEIEAEFRDWMKSERGVFKKAFNTIHIVARAKAKLGVWCDTTVQIRGKGVQKLEPVYGRTLREAAELVFKKLVKLARDIKEVFVDHRHHQLHLGRQLVRIPIEVDNGPYLG